MSTQHASKTLRKAAKAFDVHACIKGPLDHVNALTWHAGKIFVGHQSGALSVYDVPSLSEDATLAHYSKAFAKKPIEQLGVIKETNSLVSLCDGNITLSDLQTFAIQTVLPNTKNQANSFALDTSVQSLPSQASTGGKAFRGSPGVPTLCTTLAVACRRRLIIYRWKDSEWTEPHELNLPHQARSLTFASSNHLLLGYSTSAYGRVTLPVLPKRSSPTLDDLAVPTVAAAAATLQPAALATGGLALGLDKLGGLAMRTTNYMGIGGMGRVARNDVVSVGDGETLVIRDALGVLVRSDGKLSRPKVSAIEFPAPPETVVFNPPYLVSLYAPGSIAAHAAGTEKSSSIPQSLTSATIAVHSLSDSLASVQAFLVPSLDGSAVAPSLEYRPPDQPHTVRLLTASPTSSSAGGGRTSPVLLLSSPPPSNPKEPAAIWLLSMRTWEAQLSSMEAQGEYAEALRLLNDGRTNVVLVDKTNRRNRLEQLEAVSELFIAKCAYDQAIDVFIQSQTSPAKVVSLYPASIAGRLYQDPPEGREAVFGGRSAATLTAQRQSALAQRNSRLSGAPARHKAAHHGSADDSDTASVRSGSVPRNKTALRQATMSGESPEPNSPSGWTTPATGPEDHTQQLDFRRSIEALVRYLTDRRQQVNKALSALRLSDRPSPAVPLNPLPSAEELFKLPDVPLTSLTPYQLHCVAQVVDTALFKCYLATRPGLLGPLCRLDNWCEIEEIEGLLNGAKRYRELLDLYHGKNSHEKAIALLRKMSENEIEPADKVTSTVAYLQKLGAKHLDLIFEASYWVFEVDRKTGVQIFVADLEEVESLPRHAVTRFLAQIGPDVCGLYLEHIINKLGEEGPEFHERLIEIYMARARDTQLSPEQHAAAYEAVIGFLESSQSYRADRLLARLPDDSMFEIRAVLLGRLGQHEGALQIYVNRLKDYSTAEECVVHCSALVRERLVIVISYCSRVFAAAPDDRGSVYVILLRIYMRPKDANSPALFEPALGLLARHGARIDIGAVLDLLPPLITVQEIHSFLCKAFRSATDARYAALLERNIFRARTDQLDLDLIDLQKRRVKITDSRVCPVCHKRLGNSVIAVLQPEGTVVHYSCTPR